MRSRKHHTNKQEILMIWKELERLKNNGEDENFDWSFGFGGGGGYPLSDEDPLPIGLINHPGDTLFGSRDNHQHTITLARCRQIGIGIIHRPADSAALAALPDKAEGDLAVQLNTDELYQRIGTDWIKIPRTFIDTGIASLHDGDFGIEQSGTDVGIMGVDSERVGITHVGWEPI